MKVSQHTEQVINKFAEMMIKRMEEMKNNKWEKGWIGSNYGAGPVNVNGTMYVPAQLFEAFYNSVSITPQAVTITPASTD